MVEFSVSDIILSIIGGVLISLSTTFNLYMKGRVTGFSGIFYSLISLDKSSYHWKAGLFLGLVSTSSVLFNIFGFTQFWNNSQIFDQPNVMISNLSFVGFGIAGFFAGIGTKLSNGCTSGHGVCGLPRFAKRSWLSVGLFLPLGIGLASLRYYFPFLDQTEADEIINDFDYDLISQIILGLSLFLFIVLLYYYHKKSEKLNVIAGFITGVLFSLGLGFGGMYRRSKINGFLTLNSNWDPSLLFLLGSAVGLNMISFNYMIYIKKKPIYNNQLEIPKNNIIDYRLAIGSIFFGLAWGLGALCPGPAMGLISIFSLQISIVWLVLFALGQTVIANYDAFTEKKRKFTKVTTLSTLPPNDLVLISALSIDSPEARLQNKNSNMNRQIGSLLTPPKIVKA